MIYPGQWAYGYSLLFGTFKLYHLNSDALNKRMRELPSLLWDQLLSEARMVPQPTGPVPQCWGHLMEGFRRAWAVVDTGAPFSGDLTVLPLPPIAELLRGEGSLPGPRLSLLRRQR